MRRLFLILSLFECYLIGFTQPVETLTDMRDGQTYKIVIIGSQTWMAENLNFKTPNSWCYADSTINCKIYGRLYTWEAALDACPVNWHLPSDEEWKILEQYIGMTREESNIFLYRGENMGTKLKSENGWGDDNCKNCQYNIVGFNALPAGSRLYSDSSFVGKGKEGKWWSSTTEIWRGNTYAFRRCIYSDKSGIDRDAATLSLGFSIRCIKN